MGVTPLKRAEVKEGKGGERKKEGVGLRSSRSFSTLTFSSFLTSKKLPVRRNYSPPLNRGAL